MKTPRTDEHLRMKAENGLIAVISREFARQLESELVEALGEIKRLRRLVNDCHIAAGQLETERNEARAEIDGAIRLCGEYATNARKGRYATLALSIRRLKHQIECELEHKKKLSDCVNSGMIANEKIFNQLTEARAEIERLNKNMRFATAINLAMQEAGQDLPDLRGHECLAKHKLLSLFDLWKKKVRPRLPGFIDDEISKRDKLIEQMREALKLVKGISSSLPSFFFDTGEDKDGNECESIYECVCAAIKAANGREMDGK